MQDPRHPTTVDYALPPLDEHGLVERLHHTIMHMIGKLGEDKKAAWPSHLAEIAHAYNATQCGSYWVQSTLFNVWMTA